MRRLAAVVAVVVGAGCAPCHEGHHTVDYYPAYDTIESQCIMRDQDGITCTVSVPYTVHHPARCLTSWHCERKCAELDKGKAESHGKHKRIEHKTLVDPRCVGMVPR